MTKNSADEPRGSRAARDSLLLIGQLRIEGAEPATEVKVRNLSATGLMADVVGNLSVGMRVTIQLRNVGTVSGQVVWVKDSRFGMTFDSMIEPADVRKPVGKGGSGMPDYLRPLRPRH